MPVHPFGGRMSRHLGRSLAPDESAYLSYYDVRLTKYDVVSLRNDWLTDNTIDFWEEYLQREFLTEFKNSRIVLLQTGTAMMLKDMPVEQIEVGLSIPNLDGVTHMFVPVNDDDQTREDGRGNNGGSHWSLVLVSLVDGVAFYYDSIARTNVDEAYKIIRKLSAVLKMQLRFIPLNDTPQQENGSDCGVYVCMFMEHLLLHRLLMVKTNEKVSMSMGGKHIDAREGRRKMLRVIEERRREGEKRRSLSKSPGRGAQASPPRIDSPLESDR